MAAQERCQAVAQVNHKPRDTLTGKAQPLRDIRALRPGIPVVNFVYLSKLHGAKC